MRLTKTYNKCGVKLIPDDRVRKKSLYTMDPKEPYFKAMIRIVTKQLKTPNPLIVPVYQLGTIVDDHGQMSYFYDMAKCQPLTQAESKFIKRRCGFGCTLNEKMVNFPTKKALDKFLDEAYKLKYYDLHYNNVMKFEGRFVLIDLEGFF